MFLRKCYDEGLNKNQTARLSGCSEPTVYRYFTMWNALAGKGEELIDLKHLGTKVLAELEIQARMRRMSLYEFVFRLLTIVVEDDLSKALFDIAEDNPEKKRLCDAD